MACISITQWEAKGRELFGDDRTAWLFVCPQCGLEMSIQRAQADYADHVPRLRARKYSVESECIGRHVPGVGCDWASYGLFSGPLFVGAVPSFDFVGKPFTGRT